MHGLKDRARRRRYAYNSFGDIIAQAFASARQIRSQKPSALTEETTSYTFGYDGLGRLTSAYGRTYSYDGANRLTTFNGQSYGYGDAGPNHAVDRIGDFDRFDYDANGNMVTRNKGLDSQQTLVWDAENRLSEVQDNDGDVVERYWYDVGGSRVKKTSGTTTTYTFFGHYEEEVTGGVTTAISHYSFGGLRIAVKRGSALYHLHGDHLGSTSLTTAGSVVEASRAYYAYGAERAATGDLQTDRTFTGQKRDSTGLMYYNARYYDPTLGTFISPDSLVPGAGQVINYNRFLYARGNPLKYMDPSGNASCATDECWKDRWYLAHGFRKPQGGTHWSERTQAVFQDEGILRDVLGEAGIEIDSSTWNLSDPTEFKNASLLAQGVVKFGQNIADVRGVGIEPALAHLKTAIGGLVTWYRAASGSAGWCRGGDACALEPGRIGFYDNHFKQRKFKTEDELHAFIRGSAVHELAHKIHLTRSCPPNHSQECILEWFPDSEIDKKDWLAPDLVTKASWSYWENWAEGVAVWTYSSYSPRAKYDHITPMGLSDEQKEDIRWLLRQ